MAKNSKKRNIYNIATVIVILISITLIISGVCVVLNQSNKVLFLPLVLGGAALMTVGGITINLIRLVNLVKNAKNYNKFLEDNNVNEREEEEAFKTYINNTRHNRNATNFRMLSLWLRSAKNSPKDNSKLAKFNLFMVILFFACILGFIVFSIMGLLYVGLACIGLGLFVIILVILIQVIHQKISNNSKNIDETNAPVLGTVIACSLSGESSFGSGRDQLQTTRIISTTYLVYIDVLGEQKKAYSKRYYNKGEKVYVYQNKKLKDMVKIKE